MSQTNDVTTGIIEIGNHDDCTMCGLAGTPKCAKGEKDKQTVASAQQGEEDSPQE